MSRALTFWTDETIALIRERFVAASVPTWICRADSPEGEFLRGAGIHERWVTSSGYMHCVSASGELLGGKPSQAVLDAFERLPLAERAPGAVEVPPLEPAQRVIATPPVDGLVLRVHARFLARRDDGTLRHATPGDFPLLVARPEVLATWSLFLEPNTEYLWITREERRALVPERPRVGDEHVVPSAIAVRLARFHLTPQRATTSEGGIVPRGAVREAELRLRVVEVHRERVGMILVGRIAWGSEYAASRATTPNGPLSQGFETTVHGRVVYDLVGDRFTRFDVIAPGDVWGRWGDANGKSLYVERPGRAPFGFALELVTGESPTDRIPPGGNGRYVSEPTGYFSKERE